MKGTYEVKLEQFVIYFENLQERNTGRTREAKVVGAGICYDDEILGTRDADSRYSTNATIPENANAFALGEKENHYKPVYPIVFLQTTD